MWAVDSFTWFWSSQWLCSSTTSSPDGEHFDPDQRVRVSIGFSPPEAKTHSPLELRSEGGFFFESPPAHHIAIYAPHERLTTSRVVSRTSRVGRSGCSSRSSMV